MGNYNFLSDLEIAKQVEVEIAKALSQRYDVEIMGELNDNSDWDFQMKLPKDDRVVSIEVKQDFMAKITGNIAVEYECRGNPSGVSTTKSDFHLYRIHGKTSVTHHLMETSKLKEIIGGNLYWKIVSGGDEGSNTKMYLFKLDVFSKYSWVLDF